MSTVVEYKYIVKYKCVYNFYPYSVGINFSRQILTCKVDPCTE